jgi:hypothetical protein
MTKRYNPEVVEIGRTRIETRPVEDKYGTYVKYDEWNKLVDVVRCCILDLDHSGTHPGIKRKLESALVAAGEEI